MYRRARPVSILPTTHTPVVTTGLKWPPEIWPKFDTMMASTSPKARAMPRSEGTESPPKAVRITTDPAPMNTSANVPTNSATACSGSVFTLSLLSISVSRSVPADRTLRAP
jgi:hypothetical protein